MDDLANLSNHCASNKCNFCTERRNRRRARSIADSIALAKPSTTFDYWNRLITSRYPDLGLLVSQEQKLAFDGAGVRYLRERVDVNHRLVGSRK